jgi:xanthine dehydrogenase YagT iron-sulfur-binding subunit
MRERHAEEGRKRKGGVSRRNFLKTLGVAGAAAAALPDEVAVAQDAAPAGPKGLGPGAVPVTLRVNGTAIKLKVEPRVTLLDALRDHLKLDSADPVDITGAKRVCDRGSCGACTMIVDGRTVYACTMLAVEAQGREIRTVEGLGMGETLHPLQEEFIHCDGMMCGFCTPGFIMAGTALLEKNPKPARDEIRKALDGNICRCGTQPRALEAVEKASKRRG